MYTRKGWSKDKIKVYNRLIKAFGWEIDNDGQTVVYINQSDITSKSLYNLLILAQNYFDYNYDNEDNVIIYTGLLIHGAR